MKLANLGICFILALLAGCTTNPTEQSEDGVYFLQHNEAAGGGDTALLAGPLLLVDGCLSVPIPNQAGMSYVPVWPEDYRYEVIDETVEVYDSQGRTVARVGDRVSMGGSEFSSLDYAQMDEITGEADACLRPFWHANHASPLD